MALPEARRRPRRDWVGSDKLDAVVDACLHGSLAEAADACTLVREFIVSKVTAMGGHLGSNLGVVELSVALHRMSRADDIILFDTGHQAYVHKILTNRGNQFDTLRTLGGLSGYPSRLESERDWIENSHASVALGYAFGLAMAQRDDGRRIVAVVGDGALTGGPALEALSVIGHYGSPVLCVFNDNGRSYAPTVSRIAGRPDEARAWFEAQGWSYVGPVDGHDLDALEGGLAEVFAATGPVVLHTLTTKGRGHPPAEADEERKGHDVRPPGPVTQAPFTEVFSSALCELARHEPNVVAITAAMPHSTGVAPMASLGPGRLIDVGIAEATACTTAAGLAMAGKRPVVALYSTFVARAIDEIAYDIVMHGLGVVLAIDRAGITGPDGASHHGLLDIALLTSIPGLTVLAPASGEDLVSMLLLASRSGRPMALRWPTGGAPVDVFPPGNGLRARKVRTNGRSACILALGAQLWPALAAAEIMELSGTPTSVWDIRCAAPLDELMLRDAAGHDVVIVTEDAFVGGGVGSAVAAALGSGDYGGRPAVRLAGVPHRFVQAGSRVELLRSLGLDGPGIARTAMLP